jgi:Ca-activated chloride channel family protein
VRRGLAAVAIAVLSAGCTSGKVSNSSVTTPNPGPCTPVDVAVAPELLPAVNQVAQRFNGSSAAKVGGNACLFVRTWSVDSAIAERRLAAGWLEPEIDGPRPIAWIPASSAWPALLNERLRNRGQPAIATVGGSLASTRLVVGMPKPVAVAMKPPLTWSTLAAIAARHPGTFRFGKANPLLATDALLGTLALDREPAAARALERTIPFYGASNDGYFDAPPGYLSAVVTDARALSIYNAKGPEHVPWVAVNRAADAPQLDTPFVFLGDTQSRRVATPFFNFLRAPVGRQAFSAIGYSAPRASVHPPNGVVAALNRWSSFRKLGRAIVLLDVSDSMGDIPQPNLTRSKLTLTQRALHVAVDSLNPTDDLGLTLFSTRLGPHRTAKWLDVAPIQAWRVNRPAVTRDIAKLQTQTGSPLYAATSHAFTTMVRGFDPARINSLIIITDGFNEDEHDTNRAAVLSLLAAHPLIHVFGVGIGAGADMTTLRAMARATNGEVYDARDALNIDMAITSALANI